MNRIRRILAALAGIVLALAATPAAFASLPPLPPGWNKHPPLPAHTHVAVIGGMPGWQITLIAVGAALLTAAIAVLLDRARAARRRPVIAAA
jgi:hypothetical protein